ncbi:TrmB family transcriptional regulator [Fodinicola feengrottensis]|nr:helix-turn-helix domain-containing protein [Fodinicola feengrottensis]
MLEAIGLTEAEQATYLALLEQSPATVAQIRECVPGPAVPTALVALEAKGLVSRLSGRPVRYQPAPPDVALEVLVRSAERELQQVRLTAKNLMERYHSRRVATRPEEIVEVVTSSEAVFQRCEQVQRAAVEQVRIFDRPPYIAGGLTNDVEKEALARGIRYRTVYDTAGLDLPGRLAVAQEFAAQGEEVRVAGGVPVKMFIADDSLGLISLERPATSDSALVIHSSSLLGHADSAVRSDLGDRRAGPLRRTLRRPARAGDRAAAYGQRPAVAEPAGRRPHRRSHRPSPRLASAYGPTPPSGHHGRPRRPDPFPSRPASRSPRLAVNG